MVFEVLGSNLLDLIKVYRYRGFSIVAVKFITYQVLVALDFLHAKNRLIHTDLKPENVFMYNKVSPEFYTDILEQDKKKGQPAKKLDKEKANATKKVEAAAATAKTTAASPKKPEKAQQSKSKKEVPKEPETKEKDEKKEDEEKKIEEEKVEEKEKKKEDKCDVKEGEESKKEGETEKKKEAEEEEDKKKREEEAADKQPVFPPMMYKGVNLSLYRVKLGDFGNAAWVDKRYGDDIQTREYRCPEVILGSPWGTPVDIWSLGCMVFELLTGDFLFNPKTGQGYSKEDDHLAQVVELLGDIPRKVKFSGVDSKKFFNNDGSFRRIRKDDIRPWGLRDVLCEKYKFTAAEARSIAAFINDTLIYDPKQRKNARQLLNHPWLAEIVGFIKGHPITAK